ncbi:MULTISPECIES: sigma 54-interacting transcriptional regulator [unclassified Myxococcus]|uniref:sigma 54-interacting transcriptional regulator n=1 Tax=unclassified Myxococcus TaxID=2648731 RepID=UPI00157ABAF7|nr:MULTISPECIES: sigma-54 dependent transcriptional regulator [unclassified Myxococcus]NTX39315.1 sigma-54-dependent Fis family transcriptional regulator [Myxococcus sp. CA033]NTX58567.1 sigma-54-dependent Fis family transcriptional regulator [Myxococcus sp. CA039A]
MQQKLAADMSTTAVHTKGKSAQAPRSVPALTVVSHPHPQRIGERLLLEVLASVGRTAALSRNAPDFSRPGGLLALPLGDPFLSRTPVLFEPGSHGGLRLLVPEDGTQVCVAGESVAGGREFTHEELVAGVPLVLAERVVLLLHLASSGGDVVSHKDLGLVGQGEGIRQLREDILRVADLQVPVLIRGETGTGKELVARAIHEQGPRRSGPFVSVNLGALSKELVAAELFGAQRGAYTGASRDREGFFRAAHGGTLFLDEVGEAPAEVQAALLRVLETGEVYPVGGHTPVPVDVRLVAATDSNLEARIEERLFKAPLLHRLAGFELRVPPLRERREDIGLLFLHFARQELETTGETWRLASTDPRAQPWLPAAVAVRLVRYAWPGNVRQLRNITRQLIIGSRGLPGLRVDSRLEQTLDAESLPVPGKVLTAPTSGQPDAADAKSSRRKPSEVGEDELLEALRACSWDLKATADFLGIPRPSVYVLIDKSSLIRTARDLSPEEITRCFQECEGDLDKMVQRLEVSRRALQRRVRELGLSDA